MKVHNVDISKNSLIQITRPNSDFEECYSISFLSSKLLNLETIIKYCFSSFSVGWVELLFRMRDWLVKPFKLKTADDYHLQYPLEIKKGGTVAFFEVKDVNNEEVLLYAIDSHLEVYFSISILQNADNKMIKASTVVHLKNRLGKIYFFLIKPFHKLIIKRMLKHVANHFSNSKTKTQ
jgi:hypothetical protein